MSSKSSSKIQENLEIQEQSAPNEIQNKFLANCQNSNNVAVFWPKLYEMKKGCEMRGGEGLLYSPKASSPLILPKLTSRKKN